MNNDMTHPLDDFARMRREAITVLTDTAADLGLSFAIEDDTMVIVLPPEPTEELDIGPE